MLVTSTLTFVYLFGDHKIFPGVNHFSDDIVKTMQKNSDFQRIAATGIVISAGKGGSSIVEEVIKAPIKDACELVKNLLDKDALMNLLTQESRPKVLAVVEQQLATLTVTKKQDKEGKE